MPASSFAESSLLAEAIDCFFAAYGYRPSLAARAPGRVNLIGDHTDYADGLAMPCAIDLYTVAVAAPRGEASARTRVVSTQPGAAPLVLPYAAQPAPLGDWGDYLRGVRQGVARTGVALPALDIAVAGNLPVGAGLSSSASLELCFLRLLECAAGLSLPPREGALLCQRAEHEFAGVPCGVLDQFSITFAQAGHAMVLDCRSLEITQTPLGEGAALMLIDSRVSHALSDGGYAGRRAEVSAAAELLGGSLRDAAMVDLGAIADRTLRSRARHVLSETLRVPAFARALAQAQWEQAGRLMLDSHASLRDDFEVSCDELDELVLLALSAGAYGARMTGGGFGGSVVVLAPAEAADALAESVSREYRAAFGRDCTVRAVRAVDGARSWHLQEKQEKQKNDG